MVDTMKAIGATEPEYPQKVSSGRVTMFMAFAFFVGISMIVAGCILLEKPGVIQVTDAQGVVQTVTTTWDQWSGFFEMVTETTLIFLAPYGIGRLAGAWEKKKADG